MLMALCSFSKELLNKTEIGVNRVDKTYELQYTTRVDMPNLSMFSYACLE